MIRTSAKRPIQRNKAVTFFADDVVEFTMPAGTYVATPGYATTAAFINSPATPISNKVRCDNWEPDTGGLPGELWLEDGTDKNNTRKYYSQNMRSLPQVSTGPLITTMPDFYKFYRIISTRFTMMWNQGFCKFAPESVGPWADYAPRSGFVYAFIWFIHDSDIGTKTIAQLAPYLNVETLKRQRYCAIRPIQMNPTNFRPGKLTFKLNHAAAFGSRQFHTLMNTFRTADANTYYTQNLRYISSTTTTDTARVWMVHGFATSDGSAWGVETNDATTPDTDYMLLNYKVRCSQKFVFQEPHSSDELLPTINSNAA